MMYAATGIMGKSMTGLHEPLLCKDCALAQPWTSVVDCRDGTQAAMAEPNVMVLLITETMKRE